MQNAETAYLGRDPIAQPCGDDLQRSYRVIGPKHQCGRLKTQPRNLSRKCKEQNAHQGLYKFLHLLPLDPGNPT